MVFSTRIWSREEFRKILTWKTSNPIACMHLNNPWNSDGGWVNANGRCPTCNSSPRSSNFKLFKCITTVKCSAIGSDILGYVCLPLWTASAVLSKILLKINNLFLICQNFIWKVNKNFKILKSFPMTDLEKASCISDKRHKPDDLGRVPWNTHLSSSQKEFELRGRDRIEAMVSAKLCTIMSLFWSALFS